MATSSEDPLRLALDGGRDAAGFVHQGLESRHHFSRALSGIRFHERVTLAVMDEPIALLFDHGQSPL